MKIKIFSGGGGGGGEAGEERGESGRGKGVKREF